MTIRIDPERLDLVEQFKAAPFGPYGAELADVVNALRIAPIAGKYVLVTVRKYREWMLGRLSGQRHAPIELFEEYRFDNLAAGEWEIFKRRWQERTGRLLDGLVEEPDYAAAMSVSTEPILRKQVIGYCDRWSAQPGDRLEVKVSAMGVERYDTTLVRIVSGDDAPGGAGLDERVIAHPINRSYRGREQSNPVGSCIVIPDAPALSGLNSFSIRANLFPTTPGKGRQGIVARWSEAALRGFALEIGEAGDLVLRLGDGSRIVELGSGRHLPGNAWSIVWATFDAATGIARIGHELVDRSASFDRPAAVSANTGLHDVRLLDSPLLMAALPDPAGGRWRHGHLNGKIDRPRLADRALEQAEIGLAGLDQPPLEVERHLIGKWDFASDWSTIRVTDSSPSGLHGETVNLPARAVTGHNWTGDVHDPAQAPEQYAAIQFHDDDLYDAGWETDFTLDLPADLLSGCYAVKLATDRDVSYLTFFVRPLKGTATAPVALLASTLTYLAYANYQFMLTVPTNESLLGSALALGPEEVFLQENASAGRSTYDTHFDGGGVRYSSRLRPVLNSEPGGDLWNFNADTHILAWLDHIGQAVDIVTDEDLHREGADLLGRYRCVITGSHPEYWTTPMRDGLEAYLGSGGRLIYTGANGFYWRAGLSDATPAAIEIRRAENGSRYWSEEPGAYHLSTTGELGGLWRRVGQPPNALVGVGTRAIGFGPSRPYRRTEASRNPRAAFIFEGVTGEVIGAHGLLGGGAAGLEIDAADPALGTPSHALVLACSSDHGPLTFCATEDIQMAGPAVSALYDERLRAEMVFFERPGGGAVFSTGSIAWAGSLPTDGFENDIARITGNVLSRFIDPTPFEEPPDHGRADDR